jgi:hypothetical protein
MTTCKARYQDDSQNGEMTTCDRPAFKSDRCEAHLRLELGSLDKEADRLKRRLIEIELRRKELSEYRHAEAFCLMLYRSKDGAVEEWIWNSRDGVTPFSVMSKDKTTELRHVDWHRDQLLVDHAPKIGDRVFVDLTAEASRERAKEFVLKFWERSSLLRHAYVTKEEAIETIARARMRKDAPMIVTVEVEPWTRP